MKRVGRFLVCFTAFWAGNSALAQAPVKPIADQPVAKKNEFFVVPEPLTLAVARNYHTVGFSPDGKRLTSVGPGKTTMIWSMLGATNGNGAI